MSSNRVVVTAFKKSSASQGANTDCVEVAHTADGGRAIRDSKDPRGPVLFFASSEWEAFNAGIRGGEFDV
ncbi:DUF397 domain-containing protein [Streptomyces caniscabiei]|uniref:DUF397 domain-containing protein n=1 Tax=Streptomyces TaxID=1883 RepID=UPI0029A68BE3|nr:DUF397 domain-containing protein [Streptomyces caniscabiei]MDX2599635.1 DUF397 domain-containing protein [Streptomyces caniscabiei]MDX2735070.1 DUF397 domain-containing protein [Streptomyces caniscabiei]MDX2783134.1 DUF397 domain-containing protein [Streptomyces caniscabiei]